MLKRKPPFNFIFPKLLIYSEEQVCLGVSGGNGYDWSSLILTSGATVSTVVSPAEGHVDADMLVIRHLLRQPLVRYEHSISPEVTRGRVAICESALSMDLIRRCCNGPT